MGDAEKGQRLPVASSVERTLDSQDRASGGVIDLLSSATEIICRPASSSKKRGWPSAAFHLSPVPIAPGILPRRQARHAVRSRDSWLRSSEETARENSVDSANSV